MCELYGSLQHTTLQFLKSCLRFALRRWDLQLFAIVKVTIFLIGLIKNFHSIALRFWRFYINQQELSLLKHLMHDSSCVLSYLYRRRPTNWWCRQSFVPTYKVLWFHKCTSFVPKVILHCSSNDVLDMIKEICEEEEGDVGADLQDLDVKARPK